MAGVGEVLTRGYIDDKRLGVTGDARGTATTTSAPHLPMAVQ